MTPAAGDPPHPARVALRIAGCRPVCFLTRPVPILSPAVLCTLARPVFIPSPAVLAHCCLQLATVGAGVDVVKVVERQPALLLVDEASPLSDWSQMDQEELQQQIQVSGSH